MSAEHITGEPRHLYLVDGSSFIFRAYHGLPPMTRPDGTPVNAVYGFATMLFKLLEDSKLAERPSHFAIILDKGAKTFRNDLYPAYKANRSAPPEDLIPQFPIIREAVEAFNLPMIELAGYEADDIIACYTQQARAQGFDVTIVSSDKDLMQLISPGVSMLDSMKNKRLGPADVVEKFGVGPERVVDVQALAGDSSDNIPGVPGIGVKTAAQLINEYGSLEDLLERAAEIKQPKRRESLILNADLARISLELVTLKCDITGLPPVESLIVRDHDIEPLLAFFDKQGFKSLRAKLAAHHANTQDEVFADATASFSPENLQYEIVTTVSQLENLLTHAWAAGRLALRVETNSPSSMQGDLVGLALAVDAGSACYIPIGHVNGSGSDGFDFEGAAAPTQLGQEQVLSILRPILQDASVQKIGHNIKQIMLTLARFGVDVTPVDDAMLMSYVLTSALNGHSLDELSALHLGYKPAPLKDLVGTGQQQISFDRVEIEKASGYLCEQVDLALRLTLKLKPQLVKDQLVTVYETLERPLPAVLSRMEDAGIKVDQQALNRLSNDFAVRMAEYETTIQTLAGRQFNVNSPKQLGDILFGEMGIPGGKKGKTGAYTTNADVLEELAVAGYELPARILDYRQLAKLKSTYTDALQAEINPSTGRIHTSYALAATSTGRLSSNDPNLQNIPIRSEEGRKIRRTFVAEKGTKLIAADYSQIELRLLAHIAEIPELLDAFERGVDIHALTASEVFGVPIEGMSPDVRRQAKAINFGIIYGISAFGLARQLGVPQREAQTYIASYFERFPGIRDYMDRTKAFAREHGYVTTIFGRKCYIQAIKDKAPAMRGFADRAAINAPIQGSAADVIRRAMVRMNPALEAAGLKARMLLQVHDELVFEVPEAEVEATIPVIRTVMAQAPRPVLELSVPLVVDCGIGDNWDEAH